MPYAAPLAEMRFVIDTVAPLDGAAADVADAILEEAGKFAAAELDPLNRPADRIGSVLENGVVRTPPGFREAYRRYVEAGWMGLHSDPAHGGQGLPLALATPVVEMWNSACMSWALCPLLNFGAIELLQAHGSLAAETALSRQARFGRMDRDDEPDRAAGRLRSRRPPDARGALQ